MNDRHRGPHHGGGSVLVLCQANVCRSVFAGTLLAAGMAAGGVEVRTAGLATVPGLAPCPEVRQRCGEAGLDVPTAGSRPCTAVDLEAASLVLVMTRRQEGDVSRLLLSARHRTLTLLGAVALAEAAASGDLRVADIPAWINGMHHFRGSVARPSVEHPVVTRKLFRQRQSVRLVSEIPDGHTSGSDIEHQHTLDLVAEQSARLLSAWRTSFSIQA